MTDSIFLDISFTVVPLIYNTDTSFGLITNILLIFNEVQSYDTLVNSCNQNTLAIVYSIYSTKTELLEIIALCPNLNRFGIAVHNSMLEQDKLFLDNKPFFLNKTDLLPGAVYSPNLQFIIDLVKNKNLQHIDYLACNTLKFANWVQYYDIIYKATGVVVGASDDKTGNIKYGADWVLESNNEDIKLVYFTDSIENYAYTLAVSTLTTSTLITSANVASGTVYTFPVSVTGGTTDASKVVISFGPGIIFSTTSQYFICAANNYITFDGSTNGVVNDISINATSYLGLIQNGTSVSNGVSKNVNINYIHVRPSATATLNIRGGYIVQPYFGKNISGGTFLVNNCANIGGTINNQFCGGVIGSYFGNIMLSSAATINNCYNTGIISGQYCGGIAGYGFALDMSLSTINITACYNTGIINGSYSGGITGARTSAHIRSSTITVLNCYNKGPINGINCGGIVGAQFGLDADILSNINLITCYNTNTISATSGGIIGGFDDEITNYANYNSGILPNISIKNCYNVGQNSNTLLLIAPSLTIKSNVNVNAEIGMTINGTTNLNGVININNSANIHGEVTHNSNTNISGGLFTTGASKFYNTLDVSVATTCNNIYVNNINSLANTSKQLITTNPLTTVATLNNLLNGITSKRTSFRCAVSGDGNVIAWCPIPVTSTPSMNCYLYMYNITTKQSFNYFSYMGWNGLAQGNTIDKLILNYDGSQLTTCAYYDNNDGRIHWHGIAINNTPIIITVGYQVFGGGGFNNIIWSKNYNKLFNTAASSGAIRMYDCTGSPGILNTTMNNSTIYTITGTSLYMDSDLSGNIVVTSDSNGSPYRIYIIQKNTANSSYSLVQSMNGIPNGLIFKISQDGLVLVTVNPVYNSSVGQIVIYKRTSNVTETSPANQFTVDSSFNGTAGINILLGTQLDINALATNIYTNGTQNGIACVFVYTVTGTIWTIQQIIYANNSIYNFLDNTYGQIIFQPTNNRLAVVGYNNSNISTIFYYTIETQNTTTIKTDYLTVNNDISINGVATCNNGLIVNNGLNITGVTTCNNGLTVNNTRIYANAGYSLTTGYGSSFKYGVFRSFQYNTWTRILTLTPANINYRYNYSNSNDFISTTTYIISCRGMGSNRGTLNFDNYCNANNIFRTTNLDPNATYNYLGTGVCQGQAGWGVDIRHFVSNLANQSIGIDMIYFFEGGQIPYAGGDLMFEITSGENWIVS